MTETAPIPGYATPQGTREYAEARADDVAEGHFSDLLKTKIRLSSLGVGTFPGAADAATDAAVATTVAQALGGGINVIDTGAHYRYGRALAAVGAGIRQAHLAGIPREAMFLVSKGGFLTFRGGPPADRDAWIREEIVEPGRGHAEDIAEQTPHCLSPEYIEYQLDLSRNLMGVETLDAFLVDQPEVHIPEIGKEQVNQKLEKIFEVLEWAVADGRLRYYGLSTFEGFRVETDHQLFQSLTSLQGLAEKACQAVNGPDDTRHHFLIAQMPFNQVMLEGFTRFNQATGQGNVASTLQAAHQLGVYMMSSHTLLKGHLAGQSVDVVTQALAELPNSAQRALQFNRSTPGLGTSLVGMSNPEHLADMLAVAARPPMERSGFLGLFQKAE